MPELPSGKRRRYADMGLPRADVLLLTDDVATAAYFESAVEAGAPPKTAANWILGDIGAHCNVRQTPFGQPQHSGLPPVPLICKQHPHKKQHNQIHDVNNCRGCSSWLVNLFLQERPAQLRCA